MPDAGDRSTGQRGAHAEPAGASVALAERAPADERRDLALSHVRADRVHVLGDRGAGRLTEHLVGDRRVELGEAAPRVGPHAQVRRREDRRAVGDVEATLARDDVEQELLLTRAVERAEPHGHAQLVRLVLELDRREHHRLAEALRARRIDREEHEAMAALDVAAQHRDGRVGQLEAALAEEREEARRLVGAEQRHVVLVHRPLVLDVDAELVHHALGLGASPAEPCAATAAGALGRGPDHARSRRARREHVPHARRGALIEATERGAAHGANVFSTDRARDGHHERELDGGPSVGGLDREHGASTFARDHHGGRGVVAGVVGDPALLRGGRRRRRHPHHAEARRVCVLGRAHREEREEHDEGEKGPHGSSWPRLWTS